MAEKSPDRGVFIQTERVGCAGEDVFGFECGD